MKFSSVAKLLEEGKRIRRQGWEENSWIGYMGFNMRPSICYDDLMMNDWELYDDDSELTRVIELWEEIVSNEDKTGILKKILKKVYND
jgi:hypothetical protein